MIAKKKCFPRQDECTREWFWRGKWYDHYPAKEISDCEAALDAYWEAKLDEKRDCTGSAWHGGKEDE